MKKINDSSLEILNITYNNLFSGLTITVPMEKLIKIAMHTYASQVLLRNWQNDCFRVTKIF